MRVLFDGSCFAQTYGGVSRYYCEMIRRLPAGIDVILPLRKTVNRYLQDVPFGIPSMDTSVHDFVRRYLHGWYMPGVSHLHRALSVLFPRRFPSGEKVNLDYLNEIIKGNEFDVYHVTGPNYYNSSWRKVKGKKPIVVTVHDLFFDKVLKDKRVVHGRRELLKIADAVIAVSEFTRREIIEFYNISSQKITVVYHGPTFPPVQPKSGGKYVLFVGARRGYKNWSWCVRALAPLLKELGLGLVCAGERFERDELALLNDLGINDWTDVGFVPDFDMNELYGNAAVFVYPSRCEGFGLPILDAWSFGCPVVLSRASCFPEIARGSVAYFDLDDEDGLRNAVRAVIGDESKKKYVEMGYAELRRFSWEKCAAETAKVYESVV